MKPTVKKLVEIAEMLESMTPKERGTFDMSFWKYTDSCGTKACAIGHAIERGVLPDLELTNSGHNDCRYNVRTRKGGIYYNFEALIHALRISYEDINKLFTGDICLTPKQVARKIRRYVTRCQK